MRMFKHRSLIASTVIAISLAAINPVQADTSIPATFNFTGAGYGHGVGMSQIGAKSRAVAGESATAILKYYYKDVEILC